MPIKRSPQSFVASFMAAALLMLSACQPTIPKEALQLRPDTLERRQLQTRVFETQNEAELLSASAALLQDLGYNIDESETELGVIVGSKNRDAEEAGQVVGAILVTILLGVPAAWDKEQHIRAAVITRHLGPERRGYAVRLTLQRTVWNTQNQISRIEALDDPEIYQEFFDKLSKAVFLEAQEL